VTPRTRIDLHSAEAHALRRQIAGRTFVTEGTMVAFPLCFPGCSAPIPADESHITALDVVADGTVYGGTSGRQVHLFSAAFHRASGTVFDLGAVAQATHCAAVCCGRGKLVACVNGPDGGRVVLAPLRRLPSDLIQEWGFSRPAFEDLSEIADGEPILHAAADPEGARVIGVTERHVFVVHIEDASIEVLAEVAGAGRLAVGSDGNVFGRDEDDTLWHWSPADGALTRRAVGLPEGSWQTAPLIWARDGASGRLHVADGEGRLFSFDEQGGFSGPLTKTMLSPVRAMAATLDGRVFGACGDGIGKLFCFDPATGELTNLGCAVSVIERRRYGYQFGDAVAGRDGQIIFGEDDDLGHLWLYFPRIKRQGG
jgi:hypothetical protein